MKLLKSNQSLFCEGFPQYETARFATLYKAITRFRRAQNYIYCRPLNHVKHNRATFRACLISLAWREYVVLFHSLVATGQMAKKVQEKLKKAFPALATFTMKSSAL